MRTTCRIEQELAIYQRQVDAEAALDTAVEKRTAELMAPDAEFYPLKASNLGEAWGEYEKYDEHETKISELLIAGKDAEVGAYFRKISTDYWKPKAEEQAIVEIDAEAAQAAEEADEDLADHMYQMQKDSQNDAAWLAPRSEA